MPVVIEEFELQPAPAGPPIAPAAPAPAAAPALPPAPLLQRAESERRERALRVFAH